MYTKSDAVIAAGHKQLSHNEIYKKLADKTIWGEYLYGFRFISYFSPNGTMEGKNHVGSHNHGEWKTDKHSNSISVKWDNGWDATTTHVYEVDGILKFYDSNTRLWRQNISKFAEGEQPLIIK